jgi:DnaA N-terminal domain
MTKLLKEGSCLTFQASLAKELGLNEAIFLQQLHYWLVSCKKDNNEAWVYNTYAQWHKQFPFFSEITIRRIINSLEKQEAIITKIHYKNNVKVKYYTINYQHPSIAKHSQSILKTDSFIDNTLKTNGKTDVFLSGQNPKEKGEYVCASDHDKNSIFIHQEYKKSNQSSTPPIKMIHPTDQNEQKVVINLISPYIETKNSYKENSKNSLLGVVKEATDQQELVKREMLEIWIKVLAPKSQEAPIINAQRSALLANAYQTLGSDLTKWREFCEKISSSKFLMGEVTNFKASLDWCIKAENIIKIQEGNYKMGDRAAGNLNSSKNTEAIQLKSTDPVFLKVAELFKAKYGQGALHSWLGRIEFEWLDEYSVKLKCPTKFILQWMQDNYLKPLNEMFSTVSAGKISKVLFSYAADGINSSMLNRSNNHNMGIAC